MPLKVYQSLWGMTALPHGSDEEWSLEAKVRRCVDAGFDGIDLPWAPWFPSEEATGLARQAGIPFGVTCYPTSAEDFRATAAALRALDPAPAAINLQPDHRAFTVGEGAAWLAEILQVAREAELDVCVETHRDRLTTDLRFTVQLLEALPELRLTADLSHYVVGEELGIRPVSPAGQELIHRIVERADAFHGRVASSGQIQIAPGWQAHREWLEVFEGWWEDGFRSWRQRRGDVCDLVFVCELGPPWYAITGEDGRELSDRWEDALFLKDVAREVWRRAEHG